MSVVKIENKNRIEKLDKLWKVYNRINSGDEIEELYNTYPSISLASGLREILNQIQIQFDCKIDESVNYFTLSKNKAYEKDIINVQNIELKPLILRLGNFILENIFKIEKPNKALNDFISEIRLQKPDTLKEEESNTISESINKENNEIKQKISLKLPISKKNTERSNKRNEKTGNKSLDSSSSSMISSGISNSSPRNRKKPYEKHESIKEKLNKANEIKEKNNELISLQLNKAKDRINESNELQLNKSKDIEDKNNDLTEFQLNKLKEVQNENNKAHNNIENKQLLNNLDYNILKSDNKIDDDLKHSDNSALGNISKQVLDEFRENKVGKLEDDRLKHRKSYSESASSESFTSEIALPWSEKLFQEHESKIRNIFSEFEKNHGKIKISEITKLFISVANELKLQANDHSISLFIKIIEKLHGLNSVSEISLKKKSKYYWINFQEFSIVLKIWGHQYNEDQEKVTGKLIITIRELENNIRKCKNIPEIAKILISLKISLEYTLSNYLSSHKEDNTLIKDNIKKNLEEIFLFYSKAQKIQGASDTFEALENNNSIWSLGKFLKFCTDFKIFQLKVIERGLTKEQLSMIFKKTATNARLMTEPQLIEALDKISESFYSIFFDKLLHTSYAYLPLNEKRQLLYKNLGLFKANSYYSRVKAFAIPHTPKDQIRIPRSVLSHKYDYKMPESLSKQINHWKEQKIKIANLTPTIIRSNLALNHRKNAKIRKSTNDLPVTNKGYARRLKRKPLEMTDNVSSILKEEESHQVSNLTNIVTIQGLNDLDYQDFDDEIDLNDLITNEKDEQDEFFDKLYKIDYKLQGIMKMHEDKLARGQKVLDKINKS